MVRLKEAGLRLNALLDATLGAATDTTLYLKTMPEQYILSIETATPNCSVSLSHNGKPIAMKSAESPNLHAAKLTCFVDDLLNDQEISMRQVSAVAVSKGPGSYTGLRIGVSTAKGLCYALDIPMIGIETLEALVTGFRAFHSEITPQTLLCPMIDARRREVYTSLYHGDGQLFQATQALIIDEETFDSLIDQGYRLLLFGTGADKFKETFAARPDIQVIPGFPCLANYQDSLAHVRYQQQAFENLAYFEPFYLKDFVATQPKRSPLL